MNSNIAELKLPSLSTVETDRQQAQSRTQKDIRTWIIDYVADILEVKKETIETTVTFDRYGLDSAAAIGLTGELEDWLNKPVDPTMLYDYPTIEALSQQLANLE